MTLAAIRHHRPVDGCAENRLSIPRPDRGLTIKSGAVVGCASAVSLGTASAIWEIFMSAEASASGRPLTRPPSCRRHIRASG
jgi:hypothetical protein